MSIERVEIYECPYCGGEHEYEQDMVACCPAKAVMAYACPECEQLYTDGLEAWECCAGNPTAEQRWQCCECNATHTTAEAAADCCG